MNLDPSDLLDRIQPRGVQTEPADGDRTRQREGWPPEPVATTGSASSNHYQFDETRTR